MLLRLFLTFLSLSSVSWEAYGRPCFGEHFSDAIAKNQVKRDYYHDLTRGQSDRLYALLILGEKSGLSLSKKYDQSAEHYKALGFNLWCDEFEGKDLNPLPPVLGPKLENTALYPIGFWQLRKELLRLARSKDIKAIQMWSYNQITLLKNNPYHHCMLRHVLESIYRLAYFYELRKDKIKESKLPDPLKMTIKMIKLHAQSIPGTILIDRDAYKIQIQGIPIVCHELPDLMNDLPTVLLQ